jgi:predicted MFS family arabinose efflux permease
MISRISALCRTTDPAFRQHYGMVEPVRWRELFVGSRGQLTAGILLVEFLVAVEALVVVAIMPAVRHDLGGLQYYGLVFTGFSLAALVASPLGGRRADRRGPAQPFLLFTAIFIGGTILCGLAPSMLALVLTRIVQGLGAGGAYTVALTALTRSYDDAGRARVLALLAGAWIIPGLLGPSFGALLASSVGWRWAFFSIVPLILLAVALALPGLRAIKPVLLTSSTLPPGWRLPQGMPAGILTIFFLIFAFIGAEYFIPLMLTAIRGRSLAEAGLVVTLGTVSWSAGNWWQARAITRLPAVTLARLGAGILSLAIVGIAAMLTNAPLAIAYVAWLLAGTGMGIAYPTAYLVIMRTAAAGGEGAAVSAQQVAERLALALGGALGGGCIALALALHASLTEGLLGALTLALISALAALALAPRLGAARSVPDADR